MVSSDDLNPSYRPLPEAFIRAIVGISGLAESLDDAPPVSVRLNPYKSPISQTYTDSVPWAEAGEAYYLAERPLFTADPVFHGGAYYVQEAGSMFVGWLLRQILDRDLGPDASTVRVLDLCAAPGGKTTHIASVVGPGGVVVANEVIRPRARILAENVQKWGSGNVAVTSNDPADFGERLPEFFDIIVVDAPCSGEGMFRKDHGARAEWSPENVQLCAARQRRIVSDVWAALRPGGVMIYSTCTFNASEDEENVRWIASELGGEVLQYRDIPEGIVPGFAGVETEAVGWHFYPHRVRSEGFYAAAIRKNGARNMARGRSALPVRCSQAKRNGNGRGLTVASKTELAEAQRWLSNLSDKAQLTRFATGGDGMLYGFSEAMYETVAALQEGRFGLLYSGVQLGELIRGILKPGHTLALYYGLDRSVVSVAELSDEAALEYLRKGTSAELLPVSAFAEGLNLVICRGIALGWAKRIGARYNNLYPSGWRVLHY